VKRAWFARNRLAFFLAAVALLHALAFALVKFQDPTRAPQPRGATGVFKLVDVRELGESAKPGEKTPRTEKRKEIERSSPEIGEGTITEGEPAANALDAATDDESGPKKTSDGQTTPSATDSGADGGIGATSTDIEYLPQHLVSTVPVIPTEELLARISYPPRALRQGIEGVVILELFIDKSGAIRKVGVIKDPGYGFADAAVAAIRGLSCEPARANGLPVAVRFRYPVRFTVN